MQFTIIKNEEDLPKCTYNEDHGIYLCITACGKTLTCKYLGCNDKGISNWESASNWRDHIGTVVAYIKVEVSDDILALCCGNKVNGALVEYLDGLKEKVVYSIKAIEIQKWLVAENNGKYDFGQEYERIIFHDRAEAENILNYLNDETEHCCILLIEKEV